MPLTIISTGEFTVDTAMAIAVAAHAGQSDKGRATLPYVVHPLRIMATFDDPILQMIAVLHDVVEDTPVTLDDLEQAGAPARVLAAVGLLTHDKDKHKDKDLDRAAYIRRLRANPDALAVKLADNADNSDPDRLALLPPELARRLADKYAGDREILLHG